MSHTTIPTVHFSAQTDSNFFLPTLVMATSARENMLPDSHYHFHLFYEKLDPWQLEAAKRLGTPSFEVTLHQVTDGRHVNFSQKFAVTPIALVRLEMPDRLPELDKILYLDGDIIVHSDLTEFYSTDLGQNYIAAVKDPITLLNPKYVTLFPGDAYVNSGVMLMNLKLLREEGMVEKFFEAKSNPKDFWIYQDQDTINYCCANRILYLHPKYNEMHTKSWEVAMAKQGFAIFNEVYGTSYKDYASFAYESVILHLAGLSQKRPWDKSCTFYSDLWMRYFLKSPVRHLNLSLKTPWDDIDQLRMTMKKINQREIRPAKQKESAPANQREPQTSIYVNEYGFSSWFPVITIRSSWNSLTQRIRTRVKLFGFFPLLSGRGYPNRMHWRLFNFIPVWRSDHKQLS